MEYPSPFDIYLNDIDLYEVDEEQKNLEIMEDKKMPNTWDEYLEMKGIDRTDMQ